MFGHKHGFKCKVKIQLNMLYDHSYNKPKDALNLNFNPNKALN